VKIDKDVPAQRILIFSTLQLIISDRSKGRKNEYHGTALGDCQ
jgi:hypothetical protein